MLFEGQLGEAEAFLRRWNSLPNKQAPRLAPEIPIAAMQVAAVRHPDPWVRRSCLSFLDHYANDASTSTFLAALDDPVTPVRAMALHGLACDQCRTDELCVGDVVPVLSRVVRSDPNPEVRHAAIPILLRLSNRDRRAREAIETAAATDGDPLVRQVATAALDGRVRDALRSRHDLRRMSRTRSGKASARGSSPRGI
jgi:HEAT repeat protein